jgi:hypothetical protein
LVNDLRTGKNAKQHSRNQQQPKTHRRLHPAPLSIMLIFLRPATSVLSIERFPSLNVKIRSSHLVRPARFVLDSSP